MTNTFINKVSAERKILTIVNTKISDGTELTGLTKYAIDAWTKKMNFPAESNIALTLNTLGMLCQRLSDRSQESFHSLDPLTMKKIDEELCKLL
ncbi:hypothetical protein [Undibacterium sp. Xuan67W]|uniref:hypothetical protein n=1 Tax=Undibacterium sp. Xuan67W TaxID=3413057 RepID=UPI003BF024A8